MEEVPEKIIAIINKILFFYLWYVIFNVISEGEIPTS